MFSFYFQRQAYLTYVSHVKKFKQADVDIDHKVRHTVF
jgi:hypothetical protein